MKRLTLIVVPIAAAAAFVLPAAAASASSYDVQAAVAQEECASFYTGCQVAASDPNAYSRSFVFSRDSVQHPGAQTCYMRVTVSNEDPPQYFGSAFVGCTSA
jgi:hypothetical protein